MGVTASGGVGVSAQERAEMDGDFERDHVRTPVHGMGEQGVTSWDHPLKRKNA